MGDQGESRARFGHARGLAEDGGIKGQILVVGADEVAKGKVGVEDADAGIGEREGARIPVEEIDPVAMAAGEGVGVRAVERCLVKVAAADPTVRQVIGVLDQQRAGTAAEVQRAFLGRAGRP